MRAHHVNILRFWRAAETFTLPDIPGRKKSSRLFYTTLQPGDPLPWEAGQLPPPEETRRWRHTLYFHVIAKEAVISLLARITGSSEFREPAAGDTCLAALVVDAFGCPGVRTYAPAAFLYSMKLVREKRNPEELTELLRYAQEQYVVHFGITADEEPVPVNWASLQKELDHLRRLAGKELPPWPPVYCVSEQVSINVSLEAPFLNSHFLTDLDNLIRHPRDLGAPLERFLTPQVNVEERTDMLDPRVLVGHLHPGAQSPGRWPADPSHGLYSAQQAALQLALRALRGARGDDPRLPPSQQTEAGLLGINGPPGTGKTTLLREIIADVVVTRARRLLKARVNDLFSVRRMPLTEKIGYYNIDATVFGNDGIVVSGTNNTAIENISRELPALRNIDRAAFPEADYFSTVATGILGEPSWGLLSAVLGRSDNRKAFIDAFWFNKGNSFSKHLREQYEDASLPEKFASTAARLTGLLREYDRFQELAIAYDATTGGGSTAVAAEAVQGVLATRLTLEYGIPPESLPDRRWAVMDPKEMHTRTPYSGSKIATLRSEIFLCSLKLHEWAICANARYFQANLSLFVDMLSNKHKEQIDEDIAATLWSTFFFCIPVVSVTLASFQRQFAFLRRGSIGWLLLDEAGQATPPSVCGALWRAKRCIIIGDTLQIPPVVTIPQGLGQVFQDWYGVRDECWSPIRHSAQFLADRVTATGAYVGEGWTGIPLRAHRRCSEPMFSISNSIAYNGQMVRVASPPIADIPTGPSAWIDVAGFTPIEDHAIAEELAVARGLLQQLVAYTGKVYLISPFRSVAAACYERYYKRDRVECGTIHTFQGKEADIVLLILGTLPGNAKARNWVAGSPNILNVAVTRARHRLYVIGNRSVWSGHRYFDHLASVLPVRASGQLF